MKMFAINGSTAGLSGRSHWKQQLISGKDVKNKLLDQPSMTKVATSHKSRKG
jgi:hypothetical protein